MTEFFRVSWNGGPEMKLTDEQFLLLCAKIDEGYSLPYAFSFLDTGKWRFQEVVKTDPRLGALYALYVQIPRVRHFDPPTTVEEEVKRLERNLWELEQRLLEKDRLITRMRHNPECHPPPPGVH